jgi:hypothetical protein
MLRISAFIAVLTLIATTATGALAQAQSKATQKGCYNSQTCDTDCKKQGFRYCERWCQNRASTQPPCR